MNRHHIVGQRLAALFLGGMLLFNYPLLFLFSSDRTVAGIPLLYLYLFVTWGGFVGLMAFIVERGRK